MKSWRRTATLASMLLVGCGGAERDGAEPQPLPNRPLDAYAQQGLITGGLDFPVVAGFASLAGPGDSTWLLFGMSLPASALRFHRDSTGFVAGYSVRLVVRSGGVEIARSERSAQVRVATFDETGRTDESVVYQEFLLVPAGPALVDALVRDSIGARSLAATDTIVVPAYGAGSVALVLVHDVAARSDVSRAPRLVMNSRRATAFGGPAPRVYIEAYDSTDSPLELVGRDDAGIEVIAVPVMTSRVGSLRTATAELPVDSLPLGVVTLAVRSAVASAASLPLLVTISDQWMVANYDEVLDYLAYIASRDEVEALRAASTAAQRRTAWEAFWARRDPVPASAVNEYREEFFERVRVAAEQFAEPGRAGWRTDRGHVYIVLGPPDRVRRGEIDRRDMAGALDAIEWYYERDGGARITLLFLDHQGFGRFELTRNSEVAFRAIADRLRAPRD